MEQKEVIVWHKSDDRPTEKGAYLVDTVLDGVICAHWSMNKGRFTGLSINSHLCRAVVGQYKAWAERPQGWKEGEG